MSMFHLTLAADTELMQAALMFAAADWILPDRTQIASFALGKVRPPLRSETARRNSSMA
jgi:hypothetical protein